MDEHSHSYIDLHCHLDLYPNPGEIVRRCREMNVKVLSVTTTPLAWEGTTALAKGNNTIVTALGLHPELAQKFKTSLSLFEELLPRAKFVGEVGLDGSKELQSSWHDQLYVFRKILQACRELGGRILSIHSRRAANAVLDEIENTPNAGIPVMHWFSGTREELARAIQLGCWFSVGPAMLMSSKGKSLVAQMPRERIITETDGPFVQLDNRTVFPWDVVSSLGVLSELWGIPSKESELIVESNSKSLLVQADTV